MSGYYSPHIDSPRIRAEIQREVRAQQIIRDTTNLYDPTHSRTVREWVNAFKSYPLTLEEVRAIHIRLGACVRSYAPAFGLTYDDTRRAQRWVAWKRRSMRGAR